MLLQDNSTPWPAGECSNPPSIKEAELLGFDISDKLYIDIFFTIPLPSQIHVLMLKALAAN